MGRGNPCFALRIHDPGRGVGGRSGAADPWIDNRPHGFVETPDPEMPVRSLAANPGSAPVSARFGVGPRG